MTGYLQAVRSELRKLLTVRSTYYVAALMFVLQLIFSFYILGFKVSPQEVALSGGGYLRQVVINGVFFLGVFPAFVCTLMITHEYRHGTILYALTSSPSRLRVLLAKIKVASLYTIITTIAVGIISACLAVLGNRLAGHHLPPQTLDYGSFAWQTIFYGWGMGMFGLLIGTLVRNQVVAIVSLLVIPNILEQILGLVLKANSVYLPFTALGQEIGNPTGGGALSQGHLSQGHAAIVVGVYLLAGWIIAAILFVRRSAN